MSLWKQIDLSEIKGQDQSRVIIFFFRFYWAHVLNAAHQVQGHWPFWLLRSYFKVFYHNIRHGSHLGHVIQKQQTNSPSPPPPHTHTHTPSPTYTHWDAMWNLALIGPLISETKMFEEFSLYESMQNKWSMGWGHFWPLHHALPLHLHQASAMTVKNKIKGKVYLSFPKYYQHWCMYMC